MSTSVSTGQDKKKILVWVSLCPGTTAGAKIPGQNLLSWDVPGKNELKNFKKRDQTSYFRTSFSCFRASFFVLEHPFLVLEPPFLLCPVLSRSVQYYILWQPCAFIFSWKIQALCAYSILWIPVWYTNKINIIDFTIYRKVASSNTSHLEAHAGFFRLLIEGIFDPYLLWRFDKCALELPTILYTFINHVQGYKSPRRG